MSITVSGHGFQKGTGMLTDPHGPLHGVRVLDASRVLAGPFCGQLLGDLGAEVIKVERPGSGDDTRAWGPPFSGELSAYFLSCNRNKQSITLDLGTPAGLEVFGRLVAKSDILLENFRAASADKLGVSPEKLLTYNPRLIVCSISGYGRTGPLSDVPGYDFSIQGLSGLMSITGPVEGPPCKVGVAVTDVVTGFYAAAAALACLHARQTSGHGYAIDLALLDCAVASQVNVAQAYLTSGTLPPRQGNAHLQIVPYQAFATQDDWLILAVGNDPQWQRFCAAVGKPDWAGDPRFTTNTLRVQNRQALIPHLEDLFRTRRAAAWRELLDRAEIPNAPVWNYEQLFASEQAKARGLRVSVRDPSGRAVDLVGSPLHVAGATLPAPSLPPRLGQDTSAVLTRLLGMNEDGMAQLRRDGVV
jgi:crotonobetainyl-CoA:carnitine CoA-transferase CaiB-like acyl-CoA transferase